MSSIERVAFFGSPEFAVPTLEALARSAYRPSLVVAQPARRAGRGRRLQDPEVALWARDAGIELVQPLKVRAREFLDAFASLQPDVAVVAAFGQIFPQRLLDIPRLGCVNLHASLLPAYRGAAPIQAAIAAGETETGVTTMLMEAGLDTGPMLLRRTTRIGPAETAPELSLRLASIGAELVLETLRELEGGGLEPVPQPEVGASYAPRLSRRDGVVDWSLPAAVIERRHRAHQPWPGSTTLCRGEDLKLSEVLVEEPVTGEHPPGLYLGPIEDRLAVACGERSVLGLRGVQRPGRRPVAGVELARSESLEPGAVLFSSAAAGEAE